MRRAISPLLSAAESGVVGTATRLSSSLASQFTSRRPSYTSVPTTPAKEISHTQIPNFALAKTLDAVQSSLSAQRLQMVTAGADTEKSNAAREAYTALVKYYKRAAHRISVPDESYDPTISVSDNPGPGLIPFYDVVATDDHNREFLLTALETFERALTGTDDGPDVKQIFETHLGSWDEWVKTSERQLGFATGACENWAMQDKDYQDLLSRRMTVALQENKVANEGLTACKAAHQAL